MPSWRSNRRYILILAAASAAILILGFLFRPRKTETEIVAPVAQTDIARLQRLTVRNNVNEIALYFSELAGRVENQVLRLPGAGRTGVVWASDRIVTSSAPSRPPARGVASGRAGGPLAVDLLRFVPNRPAALYRVTAPQPLSFNVRYAADFYASGVWAVAVWRDSDSLLAYQVGQYLGPATADCNGFTGSQVRLNIELTPEMLGGAVFDSDGGLMGLIVGCSGGIVALGAATIEASLTAPQQIEDLLAGQFGLAVGALSEDERRVLGVEKGVLVRQVWRGYQAALAGLLPGDVIVELDGQPVTAAADLERMTLPVAREVFDLAVVRGGRRREVHMKARPDTQPAYGPGGVAWERSPEGIAIRSVQPESRLAQAGVRADDRILQVDGRPAESPSAIDKILAEPQRRVFAVFERDGRLWGALL
jgi:hypothetical protein